MSENNYPDLAPFFVCSEFSVRLDSVTSVVPITRHTGRGRGGDKYIVEYGVRVANGEEQPHIITFDNEDSRDEFRMHLESELGIVHEVPETTDD